MTKKQFDTIAEAIRKQQNAQPLWLRGESTLARTARNLADTFQDIEPRFVSERFFRACGLTHDGFPGDLDDFTWMFLRKGDTVIATRSGEHFRALRREGYEVLDATKYDGRKLPAQEFKNHPVTTITIT